jgi:hypothetical protein
MRLYLFLKSNLVFAFVLETIHTATNSYTKQAPIRYRRSVALLESLGAD